MAGNTGKMTNEAIRVRGPRMVLVRFLSGGAMSIAVDDQPILEPHVVLAKSYSRSYLERIAKVNKESRAT